MSDSNDYKTFKDCHSSLFTCIKQSPKDVSDRLLRRDPSTKRSRLS